MSIYEDITGKIVAAIESGQTKAGSWKMPWHSAGTRPVNIETGNQYRGMNTLSLWCEAQSQGYGTGVWGTFKQWKGKGAAVKRGAKGTPVVFWKPLPHDEQKADDQARFVLKTACVFNASQVDGYYPPLSSVETPDLVPAAENFIARIDGLDLRFGGDKAYYHPRLDYVQMPAMSDFRSTHGLYSTLLHECGHWTGHKNRLARDFSGKFGDEAYSFEELVAELTAAFLCADLGLSSQPREDHAQYIASWLRVLRSDTRGIFRASSEAAKAADYLSQFSEKKEKAA